MVDTLNRDEVYPTAAGGGSDDGQVASAEFERKLIKTAKLDVEAPDAEGYYKTLAACAQELGGYESGYDISNYEMYSVVNVTFKLPPEKLNDFVRFAGEGEGVTVVNSKMNTTDVTDDYYDVQSRLESKRRSLDQYYEIMKTAATIDEIVKLQSSVDRLTEEIESLEGKLKLWNSQVDMSTVTLYIRQNNDPVKIRKEISWDSMSLDDMAYLTKSGFVTVVNGLVSMLKWIAIAVMVCSPLLAIAAVTLLIVFLAVRRAKRKRNK